LFNAQRIFNNTKAKVICQLPVFISAIKIRSLL
jgi:hypothetical protein